MKTFEHIISLGHFCSPAMEFERIGCRKCSFPFDWLITPDLNTVMDLIENGFEDFLNSEYLYQLKEFPSYYRNVKWNMDFYHDFSPLKSLDSQMADVEEKYNRRIHRFYQEIQKPTLFCRYITPQDVPYMVENHYRIRDFFKKYNCKNDIFYIANEGVCGIPDTIPVYYVAKDEKDDVCRIFLEKMPSLKAYLLDNVEQAVQKKQQPKTVRTMLRKLNKRIRLTLHLVYRHDKQV